ncbi:alpha-1,3-mannosyl-glycoprotein 2-beta-N-acetylglucosaminyltransferase-like [Sycon ciliatum]|uniref:alpha-1,3-mannosyl-glycoprotein 2-beta-N-acetylglucosaminyltransferase-like n=1 Tax=Sycon ciliatum TaxID=27933 RepID=UPI0031F67AB1|eukprot:scpid68906/ scgid27742/ Alpha-1,3-mannosyl-glycoprotein 2-beta-N-acetylglucosaminyltransferase; N-glycosyl-oligosaccharide-glycoprotein N-acetylglucosaminyltransferase I
MMNTRRPQRWLLIGIPFVLVTIILYFQLESHSNSSTNNRNGLDIGNVLERERRTWQSNLHSLREELRQMQAKQIELLALVNDNARQAELVRKAAAENPKQPVFNEPMIEQQPTVAQPAPVVHDVVRTAGKNTVIAVLVMGCNRPDALKRSLTQIFKRRPSAEQFPVVVSLDCGHSGAEQAVAEFGNSVSKLIKQPDLAPPDLGNISPSKRRMFEGYTKISRHYKFALTEVFEKMKYETVVIVEDDLDISEDFFDYMAAGERLMAQDKSLWCVSAWNDNGKAGFIDTDHPELLHRTDFFPGLGWMLKRAVWDELSPKWPKAFWDDWMRNPAQRKDRACLSPEISRTYTFGLVGVSQGQYWKQHLQYIQINNKPVKFNQLNLDYLLKTQYDEAFDKAVYGSPEVAFSGIPLNGAKSVRVLYANNIDFKMKAKKLGIMDDLRAGVPRMAYKGVVSFLSSGQRVYLAPSKPWVGYVDK